MIVDLPAFGIADQADVGEQLELQPQVLLFARAARAASCAARGWSRSRSARCPGRRGRPWRSASRSPSSVRSAIWTYSPVRRSLVHHRPDRHVQRRCPRRSCRCGSSPRRWRRLPAANSRLEPEVEEGVEVGVGDDEDRAAVPAVAAVRTAARDELLAAEAHARRAPPWPAATWMSTSSTNMTWGSASAAAGPQEGRGVRDRRRGSP